MIPAIDPAVDYKAFVRRAYDACAAAYDISRKAEPGIEIQGLSDRLNDGDAVLDIGCGAGVPIAKSLAAPYRVTGVDISQEMIHRAQKNVPAGDFVCADIMSATPPSIQLQCGGGVIFHIPPSQRGAPGPVSENSPVAQARRVPAMHSQSLQ